MPCGSITSSLPALAGRHGGTVADLHNRSTSTVGRCYAVVSLNWLFSAKIYYCLGAGPSLT